MFHFYPGLPTNILDTLSAHFKTTILTLVFNTDFLSSRDVISKMLAAYAL